MLIPDEVRVSQRAKCVRLRVLPNGKVELVLPPGVELRSLSGFLHDKAEWVSRARERIQARARMQGQSCREWPGELELAALNEHWRLDQGDAGARGRIREDSPGRRLWLDGAVEPVQAHRLLRLWLLNRARQRLPPWLLEVSRQTGLVHTSVRVKDLRSRWGSCSAQRNLNLSSRLLFLPHRLVDYVLVHELCHLEHLHHGRAFWALVAYHRPDWAVLDRQVRKAGALLPKWLECPQDA